MPKTYKIGTRGSLLATTQCTLIKNEMSQKTGHQFELELIKTQGDQQTEKPLWQMDGKDFFTKELDAALLADKVDLVVHSYKDLGSDRPEGIALATIGKRAFAHDILLINKNTIDKIKNKDEFIVGTSSPRRITNVESSLKDFLPKASEDLTVKCKMLRGNVNTRIQKLKDGQYDAIVLALAGIERLANKEESKQELEKLLTDLTFMILPQKVFPSSASQGALAIEYNANREDPELYKTLRSVHCPITEEEVKRERKAFQTYGGGCHLAVGIHVRKHKNLFIHIEKGEHDNQKIEKRSIEGINYTPLRGKTSYLVLGDQDVLINKEILDATPSAQHLFVTSKYCLPTAKKAKAQSIWSSGIMTAKKLAQEGLWVQGSAEGLGHEEILNLTQSKAVQIMLGKGKWQVLSHDQAQSSVGEVLPCYKRMEQNINFDPAIADVFYWSSFYQYQVYTQKYPEIKNKIHACGLGKTFDQFLENKIDVFPFIDMNTFKAMTNEVRL